MIIKRDEAKDKIVERKYFFLSQSDKLRILERIFPILEETDHVKDLIKDGDLPKLDNKTINLLESKTYLNIPFSESLKPIFISELKESLMGVTNEYLELQLNHSNKNQYIIVGNIEKKGICPCCQYYSIGYGEEGFHDICPVCFWQNGGDGPNGGSTLTEAQNNFKLFGAMDKGSLQFIDPEGKIKYKKDES